MEITDVCRVIQPAEQMARSCHFFLLNLPRLSYFKLSYSSHLLKTESEQLSRHASIFKAIPLDVASSLYISQSNESGLKAVTSSIE